MMSDLRSWLRLGAALLAIAPISASFGYAEADLEKLKRTGSCVACDLSGADLYEVDLFGADLSRANLQKADLTAADLTLAKLTGADLRDAIFEETNLSGADLRKVAMKKSTLAGAIYDSERTRTALGYKELKLGMNIFEVERFCAITNVNGKASDPTNPAVTQTSEFLGKCFNDDDMPYAFGFSGQGATGLLDYLQVKVAYYTDDDYQDLIKLLGEKYTLDRSFTAQEVAAFNQNRTQPGRSLDTIFADGQVTLSVVSDGSGLRSQLTYRNPENALRFLESKGGKREVNLVDIPKVSVDLYKLVGSYRLSDIADYSLAIEGRFDTAYLEIDVFENELAGEIAIDGFGVRARLQITKIKEAAENWLKVELQPVEGATRDGQPLEMAILFSEDGETVTGEWINWFILQGDGKREADAFTGKRNQSLWQTIRESNRLDMYEAYLRMEPFGIYSGIARTQVAALGGNPATVTPPAKRETETKTTSQDPLVGLWRYDYRYGANANFYLMVGEDLQGNLLGFQWQHGGGNQQSISDARELDIERLDDRSYAWTSAKALSYGGAVLATTDSARQGKLLLKQSETNADMLEASALFARFSSAPSTQHLKQVAADVAINVAIPVSIPQDFPVPFAAAGPSQSITTVDALSTTTLQSSGRLETPLGNHPLAGVWQRDITEGTHNFGACYLTVAAAADGSIKARNWKTMKPGIASTKNTFGKMDGLDVVDLRDLTIKPASGKKIFAWSSSAEIQLLDGDFTRALPPEKSGTILLDDNQQVFRASERICSRESFSSDTFRKLDQQAMLALQIPDSMFDGLLSSSYPTSGIPQSASDERKDAPSTTTAGGVWNQIGVQNFDPATDLIVGLWSWRDGMWGPADQCFVFIGRENDGSLVGKSWEDRKFTNPPGEKPLAGSPIVGVRNITLKETSAGQFDWKADRNLEPQAAGIPSWTGARPSGEFSLQRNKNDELILKTNNRICRKSPHDLAETSFKRLSVRDMLAYQPPAELMRGLPRFMASASESGSTDISGIEEVKKKNLGSETESDEGR